MSKKYGPHSALNGQSPATARRAPELPDGSTPGALAKLKRMQLWTHPKTLPCIS